MATCCDGRVSFLFGLLILFAPGAGALAIVLWIGAYSLVFGIFLLALALPMAPPTHYAANIMLSGYRHCLA
jgi:uncharacterized membrane protein HdeD (DUF308 family)